MPWPVQAHRAYRWTREGWGTGRWVLGDGRAELARLQEGGWGRTATLRTPRASWTLTRQGAWSPRLVVADGRGAEVAALAGLGRRSAPLSGSLAGLWWRHASWWTMRYELHDAAGRVLARLRPAGRHVEADADPGLAQLELVLATGLLACRYAQDAATVATVVAVT